MQGYEVQGPNGERGWWDGKKVSPVGPSGMPAAPAAKLSPTDAKAIQASRDEASKALNTATQAERFLDVNKDVSTGGWSGAPGWIGDGVRAVRSAVDPRFAQMESITSAVAPGLRPPGSGSSSDKDVQFYTRGFTNTHVPYETNKATSGRLHAQSDKEAAHASFVDTWAQKRGSLLGSEPAFAKYWADKTATPANPFAQAATKAPHQMTDAEIKASLGL